MDARTWRATDTARGNRVRQPAWRTHADMRGSRCCGTLHACVGVGTSMQPCYAVTKTACSAGRCLQWAWLLSGFSTAVMHVSEPSRRSAEALNRHQCDSRACWVDTNASV